MSGPKVNDASAKNQRWREQSLLTNALLGGVSAMRKVGRKFLPQFEYEENKDWEARRDSTFLYNEYGRTVTRIVGLPFTTPIEIEEDTPAEMREWYEDVDLQGSNITAFARDVLKAGINDGLTFILVDYPIVRERLDLQTERQRKLRPYWVHIKAQDVLDIRAKRVDGRWVLTQVRIMETFEKPDPSNRWGGTIREQVRVIEPGNVEIWYRPDANKDIWEMDAELSGPMTMDEIPLVCFCPGKTGFMDAAPVLGDLASKNLEHWQSSSDQRYILHRARVPILFLRCMSKKDGTITLGPNSALMSENPAADVKWVEITGSAIEAGRQDLLDIEDQMSRLAGEIILRLAKPKTAEEVSTNASQNGASLEAMVTELQDDFKACMKLSAKWVGQEEGGSCKITCEWKDLGLDTQELMFLLEAVKIGKITDEAWLWNLKRAGKLPEDADLDEELEKLKAMNELPPEDNSAVNVNKFKINRDANGRAIGFEKE